MPYSANGRRRKRGIQETKPRYAEILANEVFDQFINNALKIPFVPPINNSFKRNEKCELLGT